MPNDGATDGRLVQPGPPDSVKSRDRVGRRTVLSPSPFRLTLFADIAAEHHKEWLIEDLLAVGEMSCWYGFPGSGKSVVIGDGAAHVAAKKPWFGRPVRQGAVLYLAAERSALVKRRLAAWRKHHQIDGIPLGVLDGGAFDLFSSNLHADHVVAHGLELARHHETEVVWVIVDTKAQVMGAGNPNEDVDIMQLVANLKYIQTRLGMPHLTIVDHVPYSSPDRMRGSGALGGSIDASFLIKRVGTERLITIGSKEPNDGPEELEVRFTLLSVDLGQDKHGKVTWVPVVVEAVGDAVGDKPETTRHLSTRGQKVYAAYCRCSMRARATTRRECRVSNAGPRQSCWAIYVSKPSFLGSILIRNRPILPSERSGRRRSVRLGRPDWTQCKPPECSDWRKAFSGTLGRQRNVAPHERGKTSHRGRPLLSVTMRDRLLRAVTPVYAHSRSEPTVFQWCGRGSGDLKPNQSPRRTGRIGPEFPAQLFFASGFFARSCP